MSHLRISVPFTVRADEHQSVKALARRFSGINDYVTAVGVQCPTCKTWGRANSRLIGKGRSRIIDEHYGLATCPECNHKVAVLVHGLCRDCGGDDEAA